MMEPATVECYDHSVRTVLTTLLLRVGEIEGEAALSNEMVHIRIGRHTVAIYGNFDTNQALAAAQKFADLLVDVGADG